MKNFSTHGRIRTPEELGRLVRAERKRRRLTLEDVYASSALSTRFLSEFERGKPNVSLERVLRALETLGLDVLVVPRTATDQLLRSLASPETPPKQPE